MGPEVTLGEKVKEVKVLEVELFIEIKKHLIRSRKKMERFCKIMRKNNVKMTPNIWEKLGIHDHKLDDEYETVRVKMTHTVEEEIPINPTQNTRRRKSAKTTKKVTKEVEEMKDLTI